jgi:hypothetical protein
MKDRREYHKAYFKEWYQRNKEKRREYTKKLKKERYHRDEAYRLGCINRSRIRKALTRVANGRPKRRDTSQTLLGCTYPELKAYLEAQLPDGELLKDYSVDHILPCAVYDLCNSTDMAKCFHYRNLQPMTQRANASKGATLPSTEVLEQMRDLWPSSWSSTPSLNFSESTFD